MRGILYLLLSCCLVTAQGCGTASEETKDLDYWSAQLATDDSETRLKAICGLADCGEDAVPVLTEVMREAIKELRRGLRGDELRETAKALSKIGTPGIPVLIEALKDEQIIVREIAAEALGQMDPKTQKAIPALLELLQEPKLVRCHAQAASLLAEIGADPQDAIPAITRSYFCRWHSDSEFEALTKAMKQFDATPRQYVVGFVDGFKDYHAAADYAIHTLEPVPLTASLGELCGTETGPQLLSLLEHEGEDVRLGALNALYFLIRFQSFECRSHQPEKAKEAWASVEERFGLDRKQLEVKSTQLLKDSSSAVAWAAACFFRDYHLQFDPEIADAVAIGLLKSEAVSELSAPYQYRSAARLLHGGTAASRVALPLLVKVLTDEYFGERTSSKTPTWAGPSPPEDFHPLWPHTEPYDDVTRDYAHPHIDTHTASAFLDAFQRLGPSHGEAAVPGLLELMPRLPGAGEFAGEIVGQTHRNAIEMLVNALVRLEVPEKTPDYSVTLGVNKFLNKAESAASLADLEGILFRGEGWKKRCAALVVLQSGPEAWASNRQSTFAQVVEKEEKLEVRCYAAYAYALCRSKTNDPGDDEAVLGTIVPALQKGLTDAEGVYARLAARALRELGPTAKASLDTLKQVASQTEDGILRDLCKQAIGRIEGDAN